MTIETSRATPERQQPARVGESFSSILIGSGTLLIQCADILLNLRHEIKAIASADPAVSRWAKKRGVFRCLPGKELVESVREPADYVFSIVNNYILGDDVLRLARKLAINYHDAPLPRYAGTHATSWALMNGETRHAITWHCVSDVVDAGDILCQVPIEISPDDTAFSLNTKCFEAAIKSFADLVVQLATGQVVRRKQDISTRTFFPRYKRPQNGCVIDWESMASNISSMVRSLSFGRHPNPLGAPKVCLGAEFFIVGDLEILGETSVSKAGTICKIGTDFLDVSTLDRNVRLSEPRSANGRTIEVNEIVERHQLRVGQCVTTFDSDSLSRIDEAYKAACRSEEECVRRLAAQEPATAPFASGAEASSTFEVLRLQTPKEFLAFARTFGPAFSESDLIHTAFGILLARLAGATSSDVGYNPYQVRSGPEPLRALTSTEFPLRFNVDGAATFADIATSIKDKLEWAGKVGSYFLDIYWRYPQLRQLGEADRGIGLPVTLASGESLAGFHPLPGNELILLASERGEECLLGYDTGRFENEDAESISGYFQTLLQAIATEPERSIAEIDLLSSGDRDRLLYEWNNTDAAYPTDRCVHELFSERAKQFPDRPAVVCGDVTLSYAELDTRSDRLAHRLRNVGVRNEDIVAVFLERSVATVVTLLGILKAGGAYLPLDPAQPKQRSHRMIADSGARVLVTHRSLLPFVPENECEILFPDEALTDADVAKSEAIESNARPDQLAYVIYTSGSTGVPKGVEIEHRSLVNLIAWHQQTYGVGPEDRATLLAGPAFDAAVWELWPYLCAGASIFIPDEDTRAAPRKLLEWYAKKRISLSFVPTPLAQSMLAGPFPRDLGLRALLTGGDRLHATDGRSLPFELFNHYGPTECTVVATSGIVDPASTETPSIGRPISNTSVFILDRFLQPVPVGIAGEIFIGGAGVARGYRGQPGLTAERFIEHRFEGGRAIRLYRTGDRAKFGNDGQISFLDRIDDQVKIRGFRIELGEVEAAILGYEEVSECVVLAVEDQRATKRLAAYIVGNGSKPIKIGSLRTFLKQRLPEYMIPSAFVELDAFAVTPNGKIDRTALPFPNFLPFEPSCDVVSPRNAVERKLAAIWEKLLGVTAIGVTDNFFELGGDSLVSVSLFVEIQEQFGVELPLSALISSPTIEQLAALLGSEPQERSWKYVVPLQTEGEGTPLFLVHAAGGNVLFYRDLAEELGRAQPVFGLQARGITDKAETAHDRIEDMARDYLAEMRLVQPSGPYRIGGSSFGGLVAFELAIQLERLGENVETLAMFDTYAPGYMDSIDPAGGEKGVPGLTVASRVKNFIRQLSEIDSLRKKASFVLRKAAKARMRLKRKWIWKKNQFAIEYNKATGRTLPVDLRRNHNAIRRAMDRYVPGTYGGDITVYRATEQPKNTRFDPSLGWAKLVDGNVITASVKGTHGALTVYPFAADLAAKFNEVELSKRHSSHSKASKAAA